MSVEEEYYINLHVEGKFVRDPHVRYLGGEMHKEIDLYVEYEIDTVVFVDDESIFAVACLQFGGDGNEGGEGGEVVGSKCGEGEGEGGEVVGSKVVRVREVVRVLRVRVLGRVVRVLKV
ncbi:hypothetical protein Gogos_019921 [Gossypium gossypioides]|uniref:Uncharacterized protein n=1 Tax=Gossypium gossypioides TaxID=34282 RepID=A0A7J9D5J5_GOSGO|nr:hypothetical protein [Gossypium gossypioides]